MTNPQGSHIWYELMTPDAAGAKAFYDKVVGWTIDEQSVAPDMEYRMIKRSDGGNAGGVLTLTDEMQNGGARPTWLGYISTGDVDDKVAQIEADGGHVLMAPWDQPGVGRLAMVTDPTGAPFYLMNPTPPEDQPDADSDVFSVDQPQHVRWNELVTSDQDRAIEFYTKHFGWVQKDSMPMGDMGDYKFINQGDTMIGAIMRKPPNVPASKWNYHIGVDDIDRAAAAVTDGGGTVYMGPHQNPGGEYSVLAIDPHGATFGLVGPRLIQE